MSLPKDKDDINKLDANLNLIDKVLKSVNTQNYFKRLSDNSVLQQQSTCREFECLSCKLIAYSVTLSFTGLGLTIIKKNPIAGLLFATGGLVGLVRFVERDVKRFKARPPEW